MIKRIKPYLNFIIGPAGTGKLQLIRQIKQELQNKGKTFACLAPTNLAVINIKGTTVHKFEIGRAHV